MGNIEATEISKIRGMIQAGLSDIQIAATLLKEEGRREEFGSTRNILQAVVTTMHRALHQDRVVAPEEVVSLMSIFDKLWNAAILGGDAETIEDGVLVIFSGVVPGTSVRSIFRLLAEDMDEMTHSHKYSSLERQGIDVESRYLRKIDNEPVICVCAIAYALSIAIVITYDAVLKKNAVSDPLDRPTMRPLDPILLVTRPTWSELIGNRSWDLLGLEGKGFSVST